MWTLVHEMRISLIFPFVALAARWRPVLSAVLACAISWTCLALRGQVDVWLVATTLDTLSYLYLFAIGAAFQVTYPQLRALLERLPPGAAAGAWFIALGAIGLGLKIDFIPATKPVALLFGICAVIVFLLCLRPGAARNFLRSPVPHFLGTISYSLYLIHMPLLLVLNHLFADRLGFGLTRLMLYALVIPCAYLMYLFVERPAQNLGRRLAAAWASPRQVAASKP